MLKIIALAIVMIAPSLVMAKVQDNPDKSVIYDDCMIVISDDKAYFYKISPNKQGDIEPVATVPKDSIINLDLSKIKSMGCHPYVPNIPK